MTDLEAFVRDEKRVAEFLAQRAASVHARPMPKVHRFDPEVCSQCETEVWTALLADRDAKLTAVRELANDWEALDNAPSPFRIRQLRAALGAVSHE